MSAVRIIAVWGLVALASAVLAGVFANVKNREYSSWAAWTFLCPPLLLVLVLLPQRKEPPPRRPTLDEEDATPY
ncbi:MAG: hypothetical protein AB7O43_20245 [Hyphomicrobiaceae bacterium]